MKLTSSLLIAASVFIENLSAQDMKSMNAKYELINDDGIYIERFDSTNVDDGRFTKNNKLFKESRCFVYDYQYYDAKGRPSVINMLTDRDAYHAPLWELIPASHSGDHTITRIKCTVLPGLQGFDKMIKNYSQSIIQYQYMCAANDFNYTENTGLIENEKNIWMHPPRSFLFKILEINPFPFIMKDGSDKWHWHLEVGNTWGDIRWKTWTSVIQNQINYSRSGLETIETAFGKLKCTKVKAEASSELGKTTLTAYYHADYGFLRLEYNNIDGSRLNLRLSEVIN